MPLSTLLMPHEMPKLPFLLCELFHYHTLLDAATVATASTAYLYDNPSKSSLTQKNTTIPYILHPNSFPIMSQSRSNQHRSRHHHGGQPPARRQRQIRTVTDEFNDYIAQRNKLKPYQVGLVWNKLGKALQEESRYNHRGGHRINFWVIHSAHLHTLIVHTEALVGDFNAQSTATVTHSLAKLVSLTGSNLDGVQSLWNALLVRTTMYSESNGFSAAQEVSNLLWAYAKTGRSNVDDHLLDALGNTAIRLVAKFKPQELANTVWAFATLNHKATPLFDALTNTAVLCIDDFKPQELANTAWAFATLHHKSPLLFDAIALATQQRIDNCNPQNLANTVWAFATLNHEAPSLFDSIARTAHKRIDEFNPQDLANTALAFAKMNHVAPQLFNAIARTTQLQVNEIKAQGLANIVWSFATLNHEAPSLFDAIARAAQKLINDFNPQGLANMVWAYATMNRGAAGLFNAIAISAQVRIDEFNAQGLANTAWAFATLNHEAPPLFDAIAGTAQNFIDDFNSQNVANTLWAFATMNHEVPSLFVVMIGFVEVHIGKFNPQELANTAWACAVVDVETNSLTDPASSFLKTLMSIEPTTFSFENLRQLHQFHLWCIEKYGASLFPLELRRQCWDAFTSKIAQPSRLQDDVVAALRALQGVSSVQEEFLTDSGYSLDVVIIYHEVFIGVEVDGPSHFIGQSHSPNGKTVLKHRQLRALDGGLFRLVCIPYWEWYEMNNTTGSDMMVKKQMYLRSLLDRA